MEENKDVMGALGLIPIPEHMLWIHPDHRIAFSHDAIRDHDLAWLQKRLSENVAEDQFVFHNSLGLGADIRTSAEVLEKLRLDLIPVIKRWS